MHLYLNFNRQKRCIACLWLLLTLASCKSRKSSDSGSDPLKPSMDSSDISNPVLQSEKPKFHSSSWHQMQLYPVLFRSTLHNFETRSLSTKERQFWMACLIAFLFTPVFRYIQSRSLLMFLFKLQSHSPEAETMQFSVNLRE